MRWFRFFVSYEVFLIKTKLYEVPRKCGAEHGDVNQPIMTRTDPEDVQWVRTPVFAVKKYEDYKSVPKFRPFLHPLQNYLNFPIFHYISIDTVQNFVSDL